MTSKCPTVFRPCQALSGLVRPCRPPGLKGIKACAGALFPTQTPVRLRLRLRKSARNRRKSHETSARRSEVRPRRSKLRAGIAMVCFLKLNSSLLRIASSGSCDLVRFSCRQGRDDATYARGQKGRTSAGFLTVGIAQNIGA